MQGAICVASIFQLVVGYTGLLGLMLRCHIVIVIVIVIGIVIVIVIVIVRYITPLTIGPSVAMIGLSLFDVAALNASKHWGVAIGSVEDIL